MIVKSAQVWTGSFATQDSTGALLASTSAPTAVLYVNGVSNAATVTVTGSNPYKWSVTLPALTAGDTVEIYASATIATIPVSQHVAAATADTSRASDVYARIGAPSGASVSADVLQVKNYVDDIGVAGAGLTALGDTRLANLDATVSSRTKPTDTQARVTLVDTTTTLTNMPAVAPSAADIKTALEADGSKLDHLWEMTADDGGVRQLTANALELAPTSAGGLTAQQTADAVNNLAPAGASGAAGSIRAELDAIRLITDAIDVSGVTVTASNDAGVLTVIQAVTFGATVSGLTISGTWDKLYWTLKESIYDDDDQAILQVVESNPGAGTDGLLYLDSAAIVTPITVADGTLTVNQAGGIVTISVSDNATVLLGAASNLVWDIKTKDAAGATVQNTTGTASIVRAVTQTI